MKTNIEKSNQLSTSEHKPHVVRLPGFITDEQIGLGDVIQRATSYFGIKPCGGCEQRGAGLNRWMVFNRTR